MNPKNLGNQKVGSLQVSWFSLNIFVFQVGISAGGHFKSSITHLHMSLVCVSGVGCYDNYVDTLTPPPKVYLRVS